MVVGEHVQVGRQRAGGELVEDLREAGRDVGVAGASAHDAAVFALHQGAVVGVSRARVRELDEELLQQGGDSVADVLPQPVSFPVDSEPLSAWKPLTSSTRLISYMPLCSPRSPWRTESIHQPWPAVGLRLARPPIAAVDTVRWSR